MNKNKVNQLTENEIAQRILSTLQRQKFADWYSKGRFDAFVAGDLSAVTKSEILLDIRDLFNLR